MLGEIVVLYILIFMFLDKSWENLSFGADSMLSPNLISSFLQECNFDLLLFPNIWSLIHF